MSSISVRSLEGKEYSSWQEFAKCDPLGKIDVDSVSQSDCFQILKELSPHYPWTIDKFDGVEMLFDPHNHDRDSLGGLAVFAKSNLPLLRLKSPRTPIEALDEIIDGASTLVWEKTLDEMKQNPAAPAGRALFAQRAAIDAKARLDRKEYDEAILYAMFAAQQYALMQVGQRKVATSSKSKEPKSEKIGIRRAALEQQFETWRKDRKPPQRSTFIETSAKRCRSSEPDINLTSIKKRITRDLKEMGLWTHDYWKDR